MTDSPKPRPPACTNVAHLDGLATGTITRVTTRFVYRYRVCRTCGKVQGIARTDRVHLHGPVSGPVCGAERPDDRKRFQTAYRSDTTCPDCLATLR